MAQFIVIVTGPGLEHPTSERKLLRALDGVMMSNQQKTYLTAPQVRKRYGGISDMGLWRWINDGKTGFPKPDMIVNGRRLWRQDSLDAFDARISIVEAA